MSKKTENKSGGNSIVYIACIAVALIVGSFLVTTSESSSDTYTIKSTGGHNFYKEKSYINLTGDAIEENKIDLSQDYWSSGKFDIK